MEFEALKMNEKSSYYQLSSEDNIKIGIKTFNILFVTTHTY